jgi:hypothetical protein
LEGSYRGGNSHIMSDSNGLIKVERGLLYGGLRQNLWWMKSFHTPLPVSFLTTNL